MGKYFGTDGIRGEANITLTLETAYKVGRFIGDYCRKNNNGKIVIGKDTRLSSSMFENTLAAGISASGSNVYLIGYCSTPCLAYIAMADEFDYGVMISASHNPYTDNGIKIFGNNGIKSQDDFELLIEAYIDNPEGIEYQSGDHIGQIYDYSKEGINHYEKWIKTLYPNDLSKYKVLVDCANGSNSFIAYQVLTDLNCHVDVINCHPNGININKDCGSTHLKMLQEEIQKGQYDLGFAFDGDADRVLFVDHRGNIIDGDATMYLLSKYYKEIGKLTNNTLVTTVMSNIGLYKAIKELNIDSNQTAVGDKNVLDSMLQNDYCIGGEQSGHIILKHDANFGDGLKTALAVLEALSYYGTSIEDSVKELKIYPQLLINTRVKDKKTVLEDEELKNYIKEIEKTLNGNGRILVRPSGTEPVIRVMAEALTDEICADCVNKIIDYIQAKGY